MFWGIILNPNTKYNTTVEKAFRISQACLEFKKPEDKVCLRVFYKELEMTVCYLNAQTTPQCALDLEFARNEEVTLVAEGSGSVHLTGIMEEEDEDDSEDDFEFDEKAMLVNGGRKRKGEPVGGKATLAVAKRPRKSGTSEDDDEEDDSDFDSDNSDSDLLEEAEDDDDMMGEEEEDEDEDEDLEGILDTESSDEEEEEVTPAKKKPVVKEVKEERKSAPQLPKSDKKGQQKQQEVKKSESTANKQNGQSPKNGESQESGKKKKKNKKKNKGAEGGAVAPAGSPAAKEAPGSIQKSAKVVNKNGVFVEVLKQGTGPVAKSGKSVHMYYRGRLQSNNKEFDHCTEGKGFRFRLGGGEVIKGWDIGVEGMKVGEKRRLVIPPKLGYGDKGVKPSIPPNAPLVFDVELKAVS